MDVIVQRLDFFIGQVLEPLGWHPIAKLAIAGSDPGRDSRRELLLRPVCGRDEAGTRRRIGGRMLTALKAFPVTFYTNRGGEIRAVSDSSRRR